MLRKPRAQILQPPRPAGVEHPLLVNRIADDRAGHAMTPAAATPQLGADDRDDLNTFLAQQGVGVRIAIVGENHTRGRTDEIRTAVPLRAFAHVRGPSRLHYTHFLNAKRLRDHLDQWSLLLVQL